MTLAAPPRPSRPDDLVEHDDRDARALEALIAEARQRTRRRRRKYASVVVLAAAIGVCLSIVFARPGSSPDVSATLPSPGAALDPDVGPPRGHTHAVIAGGPGLVAVGATDAFDDEAAIWTSADGRTWSRVPGEQLGPGAIDDVTPGGPGLVAVGRSGEAGRFRAGIWTSQDGLTWSREPHDPVFDRASIAAISAGGPGVVAVGGPKRAWFSSDGLTWHLASVPPAPKDVYPGDDGRTPALSMTDVAAAGDRLVAVGSALIYDDPPAPRNSHYFQQVIVWTSADGRTWTHVPLDPEVFPESDPTLNVSVTKVTGGPDGFTIAVPRILDKRYAGDATWTSSDGLRWHRE